MMLENQSLPLEHYQTFRLHMANQIRPIKKVLPKFAHLGIFINRRTKAILIILEISWNWIKKLPSIIKSLQKITINTDKTMMPEFLSDYLPWKTIEVCHCQTKLLLTEEQIDHKLQLEVLSAIVLVRQLDKFCKPDTEISKISRNKQALKVRLK